MKNRTLETKTHKNQIYIIAPVGVLIVMGMLSV